jgi:hypothetical protein
MTNRVCWSVLAALATTALCACGESNASAKKGTAFPANDTVPAGPAVKGIPPDIARFFAATKVSSKCPNDTTCVYLQTFPTGATREITLRVSPNARPPGDMAKATPGGIPIYGFSYAANFQGEPATLDLNYYVAKEGLPSGPAKTAQASSPRSEEPRGAALAQLASLRTREPRDNARMQLAASAQSPGGAGIYWGEVGKKGADAAIGGMIDLAKAKGVKKTGPLGSIYSLASALSDVSEAMDLSEQHGKWLKELDALEKCAANPTNQVARSDPNYSRNTVAKVQSARSELTEVTGVRFLNKMNEKAADLTPVTAILAVGLKQGFAWSEQTLSDVSKNTIMREAEVAVVKCEDPGNPAGNLDLVAECQAKPNDHTTTHITANVSWEWQMGVKYQYLPVKYLPRGNYSYSAIRKVGSCTITKTATGTIDDTGHLWIFDDPARQKELGYDYEAQFNNWPAMVTTSISGPGSCGIETPVLQDINWVPTMRGYRGTGGHIEGVMPGPSCLPGQPSTMKWAFSVPPAKR